uniref:Uncharacterized protein n=1 Tax=Thermosporothrix sp. COM3 TaxID=2490863 RepID=A0A455SI09_9CHLR|nr:hypothetical protein KTC_19510 [Thermosporothrix sp. COM3]
MKVVELCGVTRPVGKMFQGEPDLFIDLFELEKIANCPLQEGQRSNEICPERIAGRDRKE